MRTSTAAPTALLLVCALGTVISGLSTRDHVRFRVSGGTQTGACAALVESGCKAAHSSTAAELLGVPISHYGSAFYLAGASLAVLALIWRARRVNPQATTGIAPIVALMGLGAVTYSVFLATILIRSKEACPFCIALYGVNAAMFVVGAAWWLRGQRKMNLRSLSRPSAVAVGVGAVVFGATTPLLIPALSNAMPRSVAATSSSSAVAVQPLVLPNWLPSKGAPAAEDELVEFSDLDCPHCALLNRTVTSVFEELGPKRLRVRFVNYPLDQQCNPQVARSVHPAACLAARGAICAEEQDRFWIYAEAYFAMSESSSRAVVLQTAESVGLDMERFAECLDSERSGRALAENIALAHAAGVRATPTVLVNGWTFEGVLSPAQLLKVLKDTEPGGCDQRSADGTCSPAAKTAHSRGKE